MPITVDASQAAVAAAELRAATAVLLPAVRAEVLRGGRSMAQVARGLAVSSSFPDLAGSIDARAENTGDGVTVTVEAKSPWGYIREFGAGRSGPHPFMLPALERVEPALLEGVAAVIAKVL